VWQLALRCGGQWRVTSMPGPDGVAVPRVTGYDMTAVLALARASGVREAAVAEYMPLIEAAALPGMNGETTGREPDTQ
jgi:hypothetical protein